MFFSWSWGVVFIAKYSNWSICLFDHHLYVGFSSLQMHTVWPWVWMTMGYLYHTVSVTRKLPIPWSDYNVWTTLTTQASSCAGCRVHNTGTRHDSVSMVSNTCHTNNFKLTSLKYNTLKAGSVNSYSLGTGQVGFWHWQKGLIGINFDVNWERASSIYTV